MSTIVNFSIDKIGIRPTAKVTTGSLYEVLYKELVSTKLNDLDLHLEAH